MRISDWSSDVCSSDLLFLAAQVVVPVARPAGHLAAVDLDDPRGQRAQEAAVMGDEHERAGPALEEALEPVDRGDRSEEHTSELQSLMRISYAVFCLQKKKTAQEEHNKK